MKRIAMTSTDKTCSEMARQMARQYHFDWLECYPTENLQEYDYLLVATPNFWGIQDTREKRFSPFYIDFLSGKLGFRIQHAGLRKELIGRAMGTSPKNHPVIIDATAGLGRDSFILAKLGFHVTALERSPLVYLLLKDALERAHQQPSMTPVVERINLIHADALEWLVNKKADIIYLDPMFPERQKSASVKKEMIILQELLGKAEDVNKLLSLALTCATNRVVVKRPRLAAALDARTPHFSIPGKSSRFDVYLTK